MPVDSRQKKVGRDADGRFGKCRSGNSNGRPAAPRNSATQAAETGDMERRLLELEEAHAASA
jgi:hypothetical protein